MGQTCRGGCIRGFCIFFSVLLLLGAMAGVALYLDPGDKLDIVGEGHDANATNVTIISEIQTVTTTVSAQARETTEKESGLVISNVAEASVTNINDDNNTLHASGVEEALQTWSSSMAEGSDS